jgi:hypothetical protein
MMLDVSPQLVALGVTLQRSMNKSVIVVANIICATPWTVVYRGL